MPSRVSYNTNNATHRRPPNIVGYAKKKVTFAGNDLSIPVGMTCRERAGRSICFSRTVKAERGFRRRDVDDKSNAERGGMTDRAIDTS